MPARARLLVASFAAAVIACAGAACGDSEGNPGGAGGSSRPRPIPDPPFGSALEGEGCTGGPDCSEGLFCLPVLPAAADAVFAGHRCARGCTENGHCDGGRVCFQSQPPAEESPCTSDEACAALADPSYCVFEGKADVGTCRALGFCGDRRATGESCNSSDLSFCSESGKDLVCYPGPGDDGRCRARCTPGEATGCGDGEFCAGLFEDPTLGICVTPSPDDRCDLVTLFCGERELCVASEASSTEPGRCFRTCDPAAPFCAQGLFCTTPLSDDRGICTQAGGTNEPCDPATFVFCKGTDVCVDESAAGMGTSCRKRCSGDSAECPPEAPHCELLSEAGVHVCLEYTAQ